MTILDNFHPMPALKLNIIEYMREHHPHTAPATEWSRMSGEQLVEELRRVGRWEQVNAPVTYHRLALLFECLCIRTVLHLAGDSKPVLEQAVELVESWARGPLDVYWIDEPPRFPLVDRETPEGAVLHAVVELLSMCATGKGDRLVASQCSRAIFWEAWHDKDPFSIDPNEAEKAHAQNLADLIRGELPPIVIPKVS